MKTISRLALATLFALTSPFSHAMQDWHKMQRKDETSGLFVRLEFNHETGQWVQDESGDWLWDPRAARYVQFNPAFHGAQQNPEMDRIMGKIIVGMNRAHQERQQAAPTLEHTIDMSEQEQKQ